jgi:hypothetical protein
MLRIPLRGKKIEAKSRNSVPKHVSDINMLSILFAGAGFFVNLIFVMPFSFVPSLGIDSSVNLRMPRNEHLLQQNNRSHSECAAHRTFCLLESYSTC